MSGIISSYNTKSSCSMVAGFFMLMVHGLTLSALTGLMITLHTLTPMPQQAPAINTTGVSIESLQGIQTYDYVVEKGDDLTTIAGNKYGKEDYWTTIWNDNPWIVDPTQIEIGQKLKMRTKGPILVEKLNAELASRLTVTVENFTNSQFASQTQIVSSEPTPTVQPISPAPASGYDAVYQAAAAKYGVPWGIIKGLHAAESNYGNGPECNASGDCGPFQFASGTWAAYHDTDHPDQNSAVDGAYAAARYLASHGNNVQALYQYGTNVNKVLTVAATTGSTY